MAELNVQPKRDRAWWPWLLLALAAVGLLYFLLRDRNDPATDPTTTRTETTGAGAAATGAAAGRGWNNIDFNAPPASYSEITDRNVNVRGNDQYAIYSMEETVLFDTDQSTIRSGAEQTLEQIAQSASQRFANGELRIYGHTDSRGSAGYNEQLAQDRAEAVRTWLSQNGNVSEDKISLHPVGESDPVASNATAEGRQQNRRVEIVARRSN